MPTFRRVLFIAAILIGLALLGAQALGVAAAHRYLDSQLAQRSEKGAAMLAWVLSHSVSDAGQRATLADELYAQGGWMRKRLELKVASDPFNRATERQLLVAFGVLSAFLVWRFSGKKASG